MKKERKPFNERTVPWTKKQVRNRHSSAGITAREANTIRGSADKLYKISQKRNLYVGHERRLLEAAQILYELLEQADR